MTLIAVMLSAAVPQISACPVPASWSDQAPNPTIKRATNIVRLQAGRLTWNGVPVNEDMMQLYLFATASIAPQPRLVIDTDPMDCALLNRIAAMVQRAGLSCSKETCVMADLPDQGLFASPAPPAPPGPIRRR